MRHLPSDRVCQQSLTREQDWHNYPGQWKWNRLAPVESVICMLSPQFALQLASQFHCISHHIHWALPRWLHFSRIGEEGDWERERERERERECICIHGMYLI